MSQPLAFSTRRIITRTLFLLLLGAWVLGIGMSGCSRGSKPPTTTTAPADEQEAHEPASADSDTDIDAPETGPATRPATQPETAPATSTRSAESQLISEYDSTPPYTVRLYVREPDEDQPGWLKITEFADADRLATSVGTFPERNRIYVNTDNVRRLRVHVDQLPLAPNRRTILQIDNQPMELVRSRDRRYVYLERQPNGSWQSVTPKTGE